MIAQTPVEVLVGARGWQFSGWLADYYPEDLPQDWQLGYYCNEFRTVLVPQQVLLSADREELTDWFASLSEQFRFCIEIEQDGDFHGVMEKLEGFYSQITCFVLKLSAISPMLLEQCRPILCALTKLAPVSLQQMSRESVNSSKNNSLLKVLAEQSLNLVWWADCQEPPVWENNAVGLVLVDADRAYGPMDLRAMVERTIGYAKLTQRVMIIFTGQQPNVRDLRTVKTLCELLF